MSEGERMRVMGVSVKDLLIEIETHHSRFQ